MRKNAKRFFMSAALVVTLCMFTACGNNNNNAADEVETEDNTMTGRYCYLFKSQY